MPRLSSQRISPAYRAALLLLAVATPAGAVHTRHWVTRGEAEFRKGELTQVVASNTGELRLSRAVKTLLEADAKVTAVFALAEAADGTVYAATGPEGVILRLKGDKVDTFATLDDSPTISALRVDAKGRLLVGVSGSNARLLRYDPADPAKPETVWQDDDSNYVWAITQTPDGNLYLATGPAGKLVEVAPDGTAKVIHTSKQANLLSMVSDGGDLLYVGTDPQGLVLRINRKTGESFVLYDAAESEITALALDADGNVYAATGSADAGGGGEEAPGLLGRPEGGMTLPGMPDVPAPQLPPDAEPRKGNGTTTPASFRLDGGDITPPTSPATRKHKPSPSHGVGKSHTHDAGPSEPTEGNAVYRIDAAGFVTDVFRQPVSIYAMTLKGRGADTRLLLGTGGEGGGLVYEVNPKAEEYTVVAKVDPREVTSLLELRDGRVLLGLSNAGGLAAMSAGFAERGTFTSPPLDATQVGLFGKLRIEGSLPAGTSVTVATRSGNLAEPGSEGEGWSKWSAEVPASRSVAVTSPAARYLQYRLTLVAAAGLSPAVEEVAIAYQLPNLPPAVKSFTIEDAETPTEGEATEPHGRTRTVTWEASDPNDDKLSYSLYLRPAARGATAPAWILLKDKLTESTYTWDTRQTADGRYELRVVASDLPDNAPGTEKSAGRVSDPAVVDNTPPVISGLTSTVKPDGAEVKLTVTDRGSTVSAVRWAVDGSPDWRTAAPDDKIFDSSSETVAFTVTGLTPGSHQISVRATDERGNDRYENVLIEVPLPAAPAAANAGH